MNDGSRAFLKHLLPATVRQNYPPGMPTGYMLALHPTATTPENVTNTIVNLATAWLAARIQADRLSWDDRMWISDTAADIQYQQNQMFGRPADAEISRVVYRALGDIYGMDPRQYNDNDLPSVFAILLYLTPVTPGNYPPDSVAFTSAKYTMWAQRQAAQILTRIDADLQSHAVEPKPDDMLTTPDPAPHQNQAPQTRTPSPPATPPAAHH